MFPAFSLLRGRRQFYKDDLPIHVKIIIGSVWTARVTTVPLYILQQRIPVYILDIIISQNDRANLIIGGVRVYQFLN